MKRTLLALAVIGLLATTGCTDNFRAKHLGGTMTVQVPANNKLVVATWKDHELWYLYRPMRTNEVAETSTFQEKSSLGMVEGKVVFDRDGRRVNVEAAAN